MWQEKPINTGVVYGPSKPMGKIFAEFSRACSLVSYALLSLDFFTKLSCSPDSMKG